MASDADNADNADAIDATDETADVYDLDLDTIERYTTRLGDLQIVLRTTDYNAMRVEIISLRAARRAAMRVADSLADRCAAQSELLSRRAEKVCQDSSQHG